MPYQRQRTMIALNQSRVSPIAPGKAIIIARPDLHKTHPALDQSPRLPGICDQTELPLPAG